ncbi:DUF4197 domain-containing protein [Altererythrobacter fulvus]|uniref:DUF4197 domain-containing protein n=1 Tax=Caenibius fulvus TaxID=2126012 RepID=UPI00301A93ED
MMERNVEMAEGARLGRRALLAGAAGMALLTLPGCESMQRYSLVEAVRRLLFLAQANAFARLMAPGGFWDNQLTRLDLPDVLGSRGNILTSILTSVVFKERLQREFNKVAERGARRAAPMVADTVKVIGLANAKALLEGGPTAATGYLRGQMAGSLIEAMSPELADALRISQEPLVGEALAKLTGVDVAGVAHQFAGEVDDAIWAEMGREEAAIRADPASTKDPMLIAVLTATS